MRKVEVRRNSLSTVWVVTDAEGVTIESVSELNRAHGWQKFRIVEVPDDETEPEAQTTGALPKVRTEHTTRMDTPQVNTQAMPDVSRCR